MAAGCMRSRTAAGMAARSKPASMCAAVTLRWLNSIAGPSPAVQWRRTTGVRAGIAQRDQRRWEAALTYYLRAFEVAPDNDFLPVNAADKLNRLERHAKPCPCLRSRSRWISNG